MISEMSFYNYQGREFFELEKAKSWNILFVMEELLDLVHLTRVTIFTPLLSSLLSSSFSVESLHPQTCMATQTLMLCI